MSWADAGILGLIAFSVVVGLVRGFIREALSLVIWVAAIAAAYLAFRPVSELLTDLIALPSARFATAFIVVMIAVLVLGAVVSYIFGQLVEKTGFTGTDRLLGLIFGLARGAVVVGLLVMLAGLTPLPADPWWKESSLIPHFQHGVMQFRDQLPPDIARYFTFGAKPDPLTPSATVVPPPAGTGKPGQPAGSAPAVPAAPAAMAK
jgi:membrane protein required for colicin V production